MPDQTIKRIEAGPLGQLDRARLLGALQSVVFGLTEDDMFVEVGRPEVVPTNPSDERAHTFLARLVHP